MMDLRIARGAAAATVAAGLVLLSSCSSGASNDATANPSSVTVTSTVASSSASTSATPTSATSSSAPATTSSSAPTTTSNPWPADFTPEQAAAAKAAIEAYRNANRVTDEAYNDPGNPNIEALIRQYIADPRAGQILRAAQNMAAKGNHVTGSSIVEVAATGILANRVTLDVCTDSSQTDYVDASGKSIKAELPVGPRVKSTANVYDYGQPNGWLLSEIEAPNPSQPC